MSKRGVLLTAVLLLVLGAAASGAWLLIRGSNKDEASVSTDIKATKATKYYCPMHPTMVSDHPADCPICQMRMVPMNREEPSEQAPPSSSPAQNAPRQKTIIYRSTMNPSEVSDKPGKDSMGMDMVPVEAQEESPAQEGGVAGMATVRITNQKRQLIGVKTSVAARAPFRRGIRAVGRVAYDETRERRVTSKTGGYIEKLHANALGMIFRKGQPMLEIYSPELLATQQEYLLALKARERTAGSSLPSVASSGDELVAAARRRLELLDVSEAQIRQLEATGQPRRTVTQYAPVSGYITHLAVKQGDRVEMGTHLMDVTDLSSVWVVASIYEYELPFVRAGQPAAMTLAYVPGKTFRGRVSLVYPTLDPATRTAQVRIEFPNPGLELKPNMFAEVSLEADLGERLAVPETAVIETGERCVVFVDKGDGFFEPREIAVGVRTADAYEVVSGLTEGEKVLTSGNFFIDSESKLKAALESMANEPPGAAP